MSNKAKNRFYYIKKLINSKTDEKKLINMFYFNKKAINFVNKLHVDYMLNSNFDLQTINILLMIEEAKNIDEVHYNLFNEYETNYASSMWSNFIACLEKNI